MGVGVRVGTRAKDVSGWRNAAWAGGSWGVGKRLRALPEMPESGALKTSGAFNSRPPRWGPEEGKSTSPLSLGAHSSERIPKLFLLHLQGLQELPKAEATAEAQQPPLPLGSQAQPGCPRRAARGLRKGSEAWRAVQGAQVGWRGTPWLASPRTGEAPERRGGAGAPVD